MENCYSSSEEEETIESSSSDDKIGVWGAYGNELATLNYDESGDIELEDEEKYSTRLGNIHWEMYTNANFIWIKMLPWIHIFTKWQIREDKCITDNEDFEILCLNIDLLKRRTWNSLFQIKDTARR